MHADLHDVLPIDSPHLKNPKLKKYPKELKDMSDLDEASLEIAEFSKELLKDRKIRDLQYISNPRSKDLYMWLCDVVDEQGPNMNKKLGSRYVFKIKDAADVEVPITMDFSNEKGQFYVGKPTEGVAAEIYLSEKDFHALLDKEVAVPKALLQGRIRVSGGISGINNAQRLVSTFLKPYVIDTWGEAESNV